MANLKPIPRKNKNGIEVTLCSPQPGQGAELLAAMKIVMNTSQHVLTSPDEFNYTVVQEEEMIQSYLNHPDKIMIIPMVNQKIVGLLDFSVGHRRRILHHGELHMSVISEFQGQGIGQLILDALIDWSSQHPSIEYLRLRVFAKNLPAIALYKKMGFIEEGREIKGVKFDDNSYDDVISMARELK